MVKKYKLLSDSNSLFNTFFTPDWFIPPFTNKKYYALTSVPYIYLNTLQDSLFKDSILSNKNIEILAPTETIYLWKNNFRTITITIINYSNILIPSLPASTQLNISYHILDSQQKMLFHDGKRSTLEMDITSNSSIVTGVSIDCTQLHRGQIYYIDFDLVIENKRWLDINKRVKIILL